MNILTASELISENDLAIVIFTRGKHLRIDPAGNGETGNWVIDRETLKNVNKIILYLRDEDSSTNRVYVGNYLGAYKLPETTRYVIRFSMLREVGNTNANWNEFASSGQNPVSYVGNFL